MIRDSRLAAGLMAIVLGACSSPEPVLTNPAVGASPTPPATPAATAPTTTTFPTATPALTGDALAALVDRETLRGHLEALQAIADEAGGSRSYATPGADETAAYISRALIDAGYSVERHEFALADRTGHSVVADIGEGAEIVTLGAHLDSVAAGPGINDNGSGIAALLVIAEALRNGPRPRATVRFAFWGAEEGGPFGSAAYVASLPPDELARVRAYLNFDMIGSSNAVRFVYDEAAAAPGSRALTELFAAILGDAQLPWEPIDLEGDSDHGPFAEAGVPTGGLFTGGVERVTEAQAARHGAAAGQPADPCSHQACDTIENVDLATLEEMTRIVAHAVGRLGGGSD